MQWLGYVRRMASSDRPDASLRRGSYEQTERLAVGGMAEVWLGRHVTTGAQVVLKVALQDPTGATRAQLQTEADALRQLPAGIAPRLLEAANDHLVLEYLDGVTLEQLLLHYRKRGKKLPKKAVAYLLEQLGDALQQLRQAGIVHADIAPGNLFVTRDGDVRLIDFGLSVVGESAAADMMLRGTPEYMAPEQLRGEPSTAATDIYCLGLCIYESLTGTAALPAGARGLSELLKARSAPPQAPSQLRDSLPPAADAPLLLALSPDTTERPETPGAWGRELAASLGATADVGSLQKAVDKAAGQRSEVRHSRTLGRPAPQPLPNVVVADSDRLSWLWLAVFVALVAGGVGVYLASTPTPDPIPVPAVDGTAVAAPLQAPDAAPKLRPTRPDVVDAGTSPEVRADATPDAVLDVGPDAVPDVAKVGRADSKAHGGTPGPKKVTLKLTIKSAGGAVYVRGPGARGPAPRTIANLPEGSSTYSLRSSTGLSLRLRVRRRGRSVSASVAAGRSQVVTGSCGARKGQLPFGFGLRSGVTCRLSGEGKSIAFRLQLSAINRP